MGSSVVFLSHITEESELAKILREMINDNLFGLVDVFVSSDEESNSPGENWVNNIESALHECSTLLILLSPKSLKRPWINIEGGAAWMRQIQEKKANTLGKTQFNIIPILHSGLDFNSIGVPWSLFNGVKLGTEDSLSKILKRLFALTDMKKLPKLDLSDVVLKIEKLEFGYKVVDGVKEQLQKILDVLNERQKKWFSRALKNRHLDFWRLITGEGLASITIRESLMWLYNKGYMDYRPEQRNWSSDPSSTESTFFFNPTKKFFSEILPYLNI